MRLRAYRRPVWRQSRLSRLLASLKNALKKITIRRLTLAFFTLPLLYYIYRRRLQSRNPTKRSSFR